MICILQHRDVNYSLVAFLHLHAALRQSRELRSRCKIVFACSIHGSYELHNLKAKFGDVYDIDIFECESEYPKKIDAIFSQYSTDDYQYFIKHDEDVFISSKSWIDLLEQSEKIIDDSVNLLATVNLSTGIPSWYNFSKAFFNAEEQKLLESKLSQSSIPNQLWGNDYSSLNNHIALNRIWDEDGYWEKMNALKYHYRGLHPVRVQLDLPININEIILNRYDAFQQHQPLGGYSDVENRYFCNSFFCMSYQRYKEILADKSLYVDAYDEVSINRYAQKNQLKFCFLKDSLGIHVIYNSVYDQNGYVNGRNLNGDEIEQIFLEGYRKKIIHHLVKNGDILINSISFYRPSLRSKIKRYLKRYRLLVKSYRSVKGLLLGLRR